MILKSIFKSPVVNSQGPWGGGDDQKPSSPWGNGGSDGDRNRGNGRPPKQGESDIDRIIRENSENIKRLFGGGNGGGRGGDQPKDTKGGGVFISLVALVLLALFWLYQSLYQIQDGSLGLKMRFGQYVSTLDRGLQFAAWPLYTVEEVDVESVRSERIGSGEAAESEDAGLMLTSDENVVDIQYEVQWKISDPVQYQFNLDGQRETVVALAHSTMREVIAQLPLIPILNTERSNIGQAVKEKLQASLDQYQSGIFIQAVLLNEAVPPKIRGRDGEIKDVAAAFRRVQDAEAQRVQLQNNAKAEANTILGEANAKKAVLLENAEGYRAEATNTAQGDASRFLAVLDEYRKAPEVTRRRLYLETMQGIYGNTNKILMGSEGAQDVVPYLPLNTLQNKPATGVNP